MTDQDFRESTAPCYPKGIAYETNKYRVVFYEWSTQGHMLREKRHWRAYALSDGMYVDGEKEYNTKEEALKGCLTKEVRK